MSRSAAVACPARWRFDAAAGRVARALHSARAFRCSPLLAALLLGGVQLVAATMLSNSATAQGLNWEGVAGGVVTPFAGTAAAGGVTHPTVALHVLSGGDVIGTRFQGSITLGIGRVELGYTRSSVTSPESYERLLFDRGFNTFHGKVGLVTEDAGGSGLPAVSAGVLWRWQSQHLEEGLGVATKNADLYVAATRFLPLTEPLALLLSGGVRVSNASLMGIAGNAPEWQALVFAAAGVRLQETLLVAGEYLQEPEEIDGFPGASMPATLALLARLELTGRLALDAALLRAAGELRPGFGVDAERRLMLAASYSFR